MNDTFHGGNNMLDLTLSQLKTKVDNYELTIDELRVLLKEINEIQEEVSNQIEAEDFYQESQRLFDEEEYRLHFND